MGTLRLLLLLLLCAPAEAHFALITPASALSTEDGGKGGPPCGLGAASGVVTEAKGGHPLTLRLQEFIEHPGHYRVALAVKSRDELPPDPAVVADQYGNSISAAIQSPPRVPVLADGLLAHTDSAPDEWNTQVVLPNINCAHCTLQIIEFMAQHGADYFYHHCADLKIVADPNLPAADAAWPRDETVQPDVTNSVAAHVGAGGGAQTSITVVNLDVAPATFTVRFFGDNGLAANKVTGSLAAGGSQSIAAESPGWAQLTSPQAVDGVALYRPSAAAPETAYRMRANTGPALFFPFDNTGGSAMELGVVTPGTNVRGISSFTLLSEAGKTISEESAVAIAPNGHAALTLPVRSTDARGVAKVDQSSGPLAGVAVRTKQGLVSMVEAVVQEAASTKIVPQIAEGADWKTTLTLVNCDAAAAAFTVNYLGDGGALTSTSGTIAVGGSQSIESSGLPADTVSGWAEVLSSQCVGGTVTYRMMSSGQESAAPLLANGARRLVIPFDSSMGLGVAIANASAANDTTVAVTLRNEAGDVIASQDAVPLARRQHAAFAVAMPANAPSRGVVELTSSSGDIVGLGIRTGNGAVTYIPALGK